MAILRTFLAEFETKSDLGIFRVPIKVWKRKYKFGFGGMWALPGPISAKKISNLSLIQKQLFKCEKRKKLHFNTKFHIFGSTWESNNFKTWF